MKSIHSLYNKFKPRIVVADFDGTITTTETVSALISSFKNLCWQKQKDFEILNKNYLKHEEWYFSNHECIRDEMIKHLQTAKYYSQISNSFEKMEMHDSQSLEKITQIMDSRLFKVNTLWF